MSSLDRGEAAAYLLSLGVPLTEVTLARLALPGEVISGVDGPPLEYCGNPRHVLEARYESAALDRWAARFHRERAANG